MREPKKSPISPDRPKLPMEPDKYPWPDGPGAPPQMWDWVGELGHAIIGKRAVLMGIWNSTSVRWRRTTASRIDGSWDPAPPDFIEPWQSVGFVAEAGFLSGTSGRLLWDSIDGDIWAITNWNNPYVGRNRATAKIFRLGRTAFSQEPVPGLEATCWMHQGVAGRGAFVFRDITAVLQHPGLQG